MSLFNGSYGAGYKFLEVFVVRQHIFSPALFCAYAVGTFFLKNIYSLPVLRSLAMPLLSRKTPYSKGN